MTLVREVMSERAIGLPETATLIDAAREMRAQNVGDVLMFSDAGVRGIVTDRDVVVRGLAQGADPNETPIAEVASEELVTVQASQSTDEAVALMREHAVRRLPVFEGDEVVGVISLTDLAFEKSAESTSTLGDIGRQEPNR
jgi:CBS domain-containing protein